jgi:hypothetical protein
MKERNALRVTSIHHVVILAGLLGAGLSGSVGTSPAPISDTLARSGQAGTASQPAAGAPAATTPVAQAVAAVAAPPAPQGGMVPVALATSSAQPSRLGFNASLAKYYAQIRSKLHWTPIQYAGKTLKTPDAPSRLLLAESAAQHAHLAQVGLSYRDVYGIINAETSWVPRLGASKDGTPNLGLAQFEPKTAKLVGLTDPTDPVQAVHAAAMQMRDAAIWASHRLSGLKLTPQQRAEKLREGVSIYYNLSSKGRAMWNGLNTAKLPIETRRHIANARIGAREAAELEAQLEQLRARMGGARTMTADAQSAHGG